MAWSLTRPDIQALFDSQNTGAGKAHDNLTGVADGISAVRNAARKPITVPIQVQIAGLAGGADFATAVRAIIIRELARNGP